MDLVLPRRARWRRRKPRRLRPAPARREALERVAQPLVGGIYTPTRSVSASPPPCRASSRWSAGIRRDPRHAPPGAGAAARGDSGARWSLFASFADGMQTLIDALAARLPEGAVRLRHADPRARAGGGRAVARGARDRRSRRVGARRADAAGVRDARTSCARTIRRSPIGSPALPTPRRRS